MTSGESNMTELRLILAMAPSFQGGHSKTGREVAEYLGIPFPLTVTNLEKKVNACGFDPYDLWPWLKQIRSKGALTRAQSEVLMDIAHAHRMTRPYEASPGFGPTRVLRDRGYIEGTAQAGSNKWSWFLTEQGRRVVNGER